MKTFSRNAQWEQRELKFEQPERIREQPEPNLGQLELCSLTRNSVFSRLED